METFFFWSQSDSLYRLCDGTRIHEKVIFERKVLHKMNSSAWDNMIETKKKKKNEKCQKRKNNVFSLRSRLSFYFAALQCFNFRYLNRTNRDFS